MGTISRLFRYGSRFLIDSKYRNRILELVNRQVQGASHESLKLGTEDISAIQFLRGRRIFIAAGCDLTFTVEYLDQLGLKTLHTFGIGRPSDPMSELILPGSQAFTEQWDYYLLSVSQVLRGLFRRLQIDGIGYSLEQQQSDLTGVLENYRQAATQIREKSAAPIFLFSYFLAYRPAYGFHEYRSKRDGLSVVEFWHLFHLQLYELAREIPGVYILDADLALEFVGKASVLDAEQSNGVYDHPNRHGAQLFAQNLIRQFSILEPRRRQIKCAVFDLDGTLWAGVLREDGASGVSVREYYLNVMEMLAARGILLALCSKNDPVEAAHLPSLIGDELFAKVVSCHLSWDPKSRVLRNIAEELNIGLDSLAFFDDSAFERAEVTTNAAEVLVFPPESILDSLNLPEFHPVGEITKESLSRTVKYRQQAERATAERASGQAHEGFLRSCNLGLELRAPNEGEISRVYELLQRTNQLNATLTRTSLEVLKTYFHSPQTYFVRIAKLKDRFGDYGLIGFAAGKKNKHAWQILDFAFSCRSAGRGVEQAILAHIKNAARDEGALTVFIDFVEGPRNQQMLEILQASGFSPHNSDFSGKDSTIRLQCALDTAEVFSSPNWLSVVESVR